MARRDETKAETQTKALAETEAEADSETEANKKTNLPGEPCVQCAVGRDEKQLC